MLLYLALSHFLCFLCMFSFAYFYLHSVNYYYYFFLLYFAYLHIHYGEFSPTVSWNNQFVCIVIGSCFHLITSLIFCVLHAGVESSILMINVETAMIGRARCGIRWVAIILNLLCSERERRKGKLKLRLPILLSLDSRRLCLFLIVNCHHHLRGFLLLLFLAPLVYSDILDFLTNRIGSAVHLSMCICW